MTLELIKQPKCATCKFFDRIAEAQGEGTCKENSPQTTIVMVPQNNPFTGEMGVGPKPVSCWPTVTDDLWCGRYTAKWAGMQS